ncbi:hypothetical protein B0T26DRAFT_528825 [Lasiosphaeria miniovina]|uniref:Myb-like domain-containing protein n=1 Tax=Lasiosphaeria miniovina TaxID=1954250 RepID=A0AA39ZQC6_9PEZI|nr:uncharacterized protein B0T26DRAFT_528825 [Lasiosphaeria miniovina]KAK0701740.1 hypothetical protein B0T26DRAFT_528825 [Lasiosphaeria miniovina]
MTLHLSPSLPSPRICRQGACSGYEVVLTQPCVLQRSISPSQTPPRPSPALSAAGQAIPDNAYDIPLQAGIGNISDLGSPSLGFDTVDDRPVSQSSAGDFNEWPLKDAVLKRVIVDGIATIQLQFSWPPCTNCVARSRQSNSLPKMPISTRPTSSDLPVKSRRSKKHSPWTREEDTLLTLLRTRGLSWNTIHRRFAEDFREKKRARAALAGRYNTHFKSGGGGSSDSSQSRTVIPIDPALPS